MMVQFVLKKSVVDKCHKFVVCLDDMDLDLDLDLRRLKSKYFVWVS